MLSDPLPKRRWILLVDPDPFALDELAEALERRAHGRRGPGGDLLAYADLKLSAGDGRARRGAEALQLTRTEFALLELFLRHPEEVLSRAFIVERVWGHAAQLSSSSLGGYIGLLRKKIEANGRPRLIQTVRGVGYVLRNDG